MSRAFTKESDDAFEELPERPISPAPNWVTPEGLAAIEFEITRLQQALLDVGEDRYERARIGRDLRYWTARRSSAHVMDAPDNADVVRFGATVIIDREDGRQEKFRIVGEDEADPAHGTISHVSPLARALIGKNVGDVVRVAEADVELVNIA